MTIKQLEDKIRGLERQVEGQNHCIAWLVGHARELQQQIEEHPQMASCMEGEVICSPTLKKGGS